jgi:uncharacterized lipoprotein YmbA
MNNGFKLPRTLILVIATIWLAGCARSPQARFYTLSPLGPQAAKPPVSAAKSVAISIAPVEVPDYLNRPQIVTRSGQNELKLAEFDRWAGSLPDNIAAVMAENLSLLLASDRVQAAPRGRNEKVDYTLAMRLLRLDCVPGDQLAMRVQWTLSAAADGTCVATRVSTCSEKLKDGRYDTAVAAVSSALGQVSREIAREIDDRMKGE